VLGLAAPGAAPAQTPLAQAQVPAQAVGAGGAQAAGWFPDPSGRHQQRYWDGTAWSAHVSDGGTTGTDPL
jgi:hypothetical protein